MARSLKSLIKLHKHELDEKQLKLARLYDIQDSLIAEQNKIEKDFEREKQVLEEEGSIGFTIQGYIEAIKNKLQVNAEKQADIGVKIEEAKDSMMDTFSELKKYEMTQEARDKREAEEILKKEEKELDEIAIEGHRRKTEKEDSA